MKGFLAELRESQQAAEERQKSLSAELGTLRQERQAADASMSLSMGLSHQKADALAEQMATEAEKDTAAQEAAEMAAEYEAITGEAYTE